MRDETIIDVYTSGVNGAEYDAGMKQLMSNKEHSCNSLKAPIE